MAKELTATAISNLLRESVLSTITKTLEEEGLTPQQASSGNVLFEMPDINGEDKWVDVRVVIPKGSRAGEPFDGNALIEEFEEKKKLNEEKAKLRAEKSLAKQKEREEKERLKAEKDKAKAESELNS